MAGLAAMARERPAVRRFLKSGANEASALADIDPDFAAALSAYHEEFGLRPVRYEVDAPSIEETPAFTLRLIADQLRTGYDPAARAAEAARRREAVAGRGPRPAGRPGRRRSGPLRAGARTGPRAGTECGRTRRA